MVQPLGQLNQAGQMLDCAGKGLGAPIVSRNVSGVQLPADSTALGGVEARSSSERATVDKSNTQPRARQPAIVLIKPPFFRVEGNLSREESLGQGLSPAAPGRVESRAGERIGREGERERENRFHPNVEALWRRGPRGNSGSTSAVLFRILAARGSVSAGLSRVPATRGRDLRDPGSALAQPRRCFCRALPRSRHPRRRLCRGLQRSPRPWRAQALGLIPSDRALPTSGSPCPCSAGFEDEPALQTADSSLYLPGWAGRLENRFHPNVRALCRRGPRENFPTLKRGRSPGEIYWTIPSEAS